MLILHLPDVGVAPNRSLPSTCYRFLCSCNTHMFSIAFYLKGETFIFPDRNFKLNFDGIFYYIVCQSYMPWKTVCEFSEQYRSVVNLNNCQSTRDALLVNNNAPVCN